MIVVATRSDMDTTVCMCGVSREKNEGWAVSVILSEYMCISRERDGAYVNYGVY